MARKDEGRVMHTWAGLRNARPLTHRMTWLQPPLGENGSQGCRPRWGGRAIQGLGYIVDR